MSHPFPLHISSLLVCGVLWLCIPAGGEENTRSDFSAAPTALNPDEFTPLVKTSPFTRVLSLSETYALRGIANLGDQQVATLYNKETKKTIVVTAKGDNEAGLSLVTVNPATDLAEVTAKVALAEDEAELRYDENQINHQSRSATSKEERSHSHKNDPTRDIERFKALSSENQEKLKSYIQYVFKSYPHMSREEKGNLIRGAMIRLSDGRGIDIPTTPTAASTSAPQKATDPRGAKGNPASDPTSSKGGRKGRRR